GFVVIGDGAVEVALEAPAVAAAAARRRLPRIEADGFAAIRERPIGLVVAVQGRAAIAVELGQAGAFLPPRRDQSAAGGNGFSAGGAVASRAIVGRRGSPWRDRDQPQQQKRKNTSHGASRRNRLHSNAHIYRFQVRRRSAT